MATVIKDVMGWLHPNPMPPKTRNVAAGSAASAPPAPSLTEERVRGRNAARDACQQAAELSPAREVPSMSPRVEDDGTHTHRCLSCERNLADAMCIPGYNGHIHSAWRYRVWLCNSQVV
jgi:hypothetical protein